MVLHHVCFHIRKSADITLICSSPQLIAACHVLLRLLMPRHSPYALFCLNFLFGSHISLELLEFQNMGFIFSHLKGFPFSALFCVPPYGETVVFVTLNFRKDLDLFDFAIVVSKNLLISKSFVFFLTICSFLYSFFIRFSKNKSTTQSLLCWSVWVDSNHRPRAYQARALTT